MSVERAVAALDRRAAYRRLTPGQSTAFDSVLESAGLWLAHKAIVRDVLVVGPDAPT